MIFETSSYLRKATSRAKSDVANKLVSMFLHALSRHICFAVGQTVTDTAYRESVANEFGSTCCYCSKPLETDRAAVEHLEGMNRFRLGLHVPGNVVVSCKRCNGEKRRDDQLETLVLAGSGWESFLSHDSSKCPQACKTCLYWTRVWPDTAQRNYQLLQARKRIGSFRDRYPSSIQWSNKAKAFLAEEVDRLYRESQKTAADTIAKALTETIDALGIRSIAKSASSAGSVR